MENTVTVAPKGKRLSFDLGTIWALLGTAFLAGIAFIPVASVPFMYTKVTLLALGGLITLVLFILARLTRGNIIVPPVALLGAIWLVPAAYALSALFSSAGFMRSFFGTEFEADTLGFVVLAAGLASLVALSFRRTGHFRTFFKVGAITLGIALAAQVLFLMLGKLMPTVIAPTANLIGSFMDLGMLSGLGITLALLALRFLPIEGKMRIALYVGSAVALFVVALANSTLVWTLVALVALGLFIEAIMRHRAQSGTEELDGVAMLLSENETEPASAMEMRSLAAPLVVLIAALFFAIGGSTIGNALVNSMGVSIIDVRPSWQSTFAVGSHTYASAPIFGSGPGSFGVEWLKHKDRALNDTIFWGIDFPAGIGYIPTSFVTTGILGVLAWLAFIGLFLFIGLRALLFRLPTDPFVRFASVASFTGSLFVLALMVFSVPGPIVLVAGALLIGLFVSTLRYSQKAHEWGIVFAKSPRIGFVIVFGLTLLLLASILASYVVVERYLASLAYNEAQVALAAGDLAKADAAITRSITFAPSDRAYQLAAASGVARMQQVAADTSLAQSDRQQQFQAALTGSLDAALTATQLNPNNYQNWVALGGVYQAVVPLKIENSYEGAKAAYERAMALNPANPTLPFILAQLEIAQGNAPAAEANLTQAITLKNDYAEAIFLLSQLQAQQGKAREALQAAEAALYFAPQDPSVAFQVGILRSANGDTAGAVDALMRAVDLNPQFANAHFFLGVMYALQGKYDLAAEELTVVAGFSPENAAAVADDLAVLRAGRNPFPPSRLGALGIPQAVRETTSTNTP